MTLDYLAHLREDSARFAEVLRDAPADGPVPTCPEWQADDLLWHLAEVQWFWGTIVRDAVPDPSELRHPARPTDRETLLSFFDEASSTLQTSLAATDPGERRWTWSEDQTAGFIRRRQAHEALIHRIDAELTADVPRLPLDPGLAADGVDEALRVMFGGAPAWGRIDLDRDATMRVRALDTGHTWRVTVGSFSGTSPEGTSYTDEPALQVASVDDERATPATVEGTAADLDCWLWGRPTAGSLDRTGDETVLTRFEAVVDQGID